MTDTHFRPDIDWSPEELACDGEDIGTNPTANSAIRHLIPAKISRRQALKGVSAVVALGALAGGGATALFSRKALAAGTSTLTFKELEHGYTESHACCEGYEAQTLIRWGDPVEADAPAFDPLHQTAAAQEKQFGYNNDYVGYLPLPLGSNSADHGLLCVNHEYTDHQLMFPGIKAGELSKLTKEQVDVEIAAHGHTVVEIKREGGRWGVVKGSPYNRRITASKTEFRIVGPAAGHDRLKTAGDPSGTKVIGTINNCAGGKTPWGTILFAEENFHGYFGGDPEKTPEARNYKRYGIKAKSAYAWYLHHDRFNVEKDPNEPNKFGWMVEYDPYDAKSVPVKRTTLGRMKHEGATTVVNKDGRVVAYMGDDEAFEYIYKFVTKGRYDPANRAANMNLFDEGTLYVARMEPNGKLTWLPLVFGQGPLTPQNDFHSQADVVIETRRAADLLGATKMDRPEDVEPNPVTGVIYAALTNNTGRKDDQKDAANPRAKNNHGHVIEIIPPGTSPSGRNADADHAADEFTWDVFLLAGNPDKDGARYNPGISANGWFSSPDNVAFDTKGRLWISTDGFPKFGQADGVWATDTSGPGRALTRHFYRVPRGAELCGPEFNTDDSAYFAAVQHPGDEKDSTFDAPSTRWPDFKAGMPPRPSVQVIVKKDGGVIGT